MKAEETKGQCCSGVRRWLKKRKQQEQGVLLSLPPCLLLLCDLRARGSAHSWTSKSLYKFFIALGFSDLPIIIYTPGTWKCL